MKKLGLIVFAFAVSGCGIPLAVALPTFTTAAIVGAGAAVGAGAVDLGWNKLPMATPAATATPTATDR